MDDTALNANLLFRLWRVRRTLMQLCRDRGYAVDAEDAEMSKEAFVERFGSRPLENQPSRASLGFTLTHAIDNNTKIGVYWPDSSKIGVGLIREYVIEMTDQGITNGVIVAQKALTSSAMKAVRECNAAGNFMQVFEEADLVVNVTHHELVPKHTVQTAEEKAELLKRYKLKEQQLPRIKLTDPIARYYGLRRGQVVKITREKSPTAGRYVSYRIVY